MTDRYCVLGNPVEHSKSPWIHARFAQLTGQNISYGKRLIALNGFQEGIDALAAEGYLGCNVTVPFKALAQGAAHHSTGRATQAQAANVLWLRDGRWLADNSDGQGLIRDITVNEGLSLLGAKVLLIGAGGAAAGALGPLLSCKPELMVVCNRSGSKAHTLIEQHKESAALLNIEQRSAVLVGQSAQNTVFSGLSENWGSFDLVINATSSSLSGQPLLLDPNLFASRSLAYDMMYGDAAVGFLQHAALCGAQARDGLGMLVEQAALAFEIWRGVLPPTGQVLRELRHASGQIDAGNSSAIPRQAR